MLADRRRLKGFFVVVLDLFYGTALSVFFNKDSVELGRGHICAADGSGWILLLRFGHH